MDPENRMERHIKYWITLQLAFGQGSPKIDAVAREFPHALAFYRAGEEAWKQLPGITPQELERLRHPDVERIQKIYSDSLRLGCQMLTPEHAAYPERLRNIFGIPAVLYLYGSLEGIDDLLALAVVGTRNASEEGISIARQIGQDLGRCGAVVISGLAVGIDTAGHTGTLESGGKTIAFLGGGLDIDYPKENKGIKELIAKTGAVVSEYPPGTPPLSAHFPIRNRLISGLSLGVVLVEASAKSGANITAEYGLDQGKDIFVIPWDISRPAGRQAVTLMRQGAVPVTGASQILEEYSGRLLGREKAAFMDLQALELALDGKEAARKKRKRKHGHDAAANPPSAQEDLGTGISDFGFSAESLDERERLIYTSLENGPKNADELIVDTHLEIDQVMAALTGLELMGLVHMQAGSRYLRSGTCET